MNSRRSKNQTENRAFTLIEFMIVMVILGIMAALVLPAYSNATATAKSSALKEDIRLLRAQIALYTTQHRNVPPVGNDFIEQMTGYSDAMGQTSDDADSQYKFGPYLHQMPVNPLNDSAALRVVGGNDSFPDEPEGTEGWVYQPSSGRIAPNVAGEDVEGLAYFDY